MVQHASPVPQRGEGCERGHRVDAIPILAPVATPDLVRAPCSRAVNFDFSGADAFDISLLSGGDSSRRGESFLGVKAVVRRALGRVAVEGRSYFIAAGLVSSCWLAVLAMVYR